VETASLQKPLPEYFTLSHCWGTGQTRTTTQSTLAGHRQGLPVLDLPKTYSDAVKATQRLGVRYLWIDSLCIIQDSQEDWEREAQAMAAIYRNSSLTISATSSPDGKGGCYLEKRTGTLESISETTKNGYRYFVKLRNRVVGKDIPMPLIRMGWVLQETVLSRRILHLTSDQIFWQCKECFLLEDGAVAKDDTGGRVSLLSASSLGFIPETDLRNKSSRDQMLQWHAWMEDYSRRDFTYDKDRLPAMAGMIQYYQANTKDIPLIGLWISTIHLDLAWSVNGPEKDRELTDLPSWTWLSVHRGIDYSESDDIDDPYKIRTPLQVIAYHVDWSKAPFVSHLLKSRLIISSKFFQLTIKRDRGEDTFRLANHDGISTEDISSAFDTNQSLIDGTEITSMVLFYLASTITYLMLEPASKPGAYRRIGFGTLFIHGEGSAQRFIEKSETKIVELV
jgi:heterokaryon incompatibility protein (HET)